MVQQRSGLAAHELDSVCHELRQPLAVIHAYAELLIDGLCGELTSKQEDAIEAILRSANTIDRGFSLLREFGGRSGRAQPRQTSEVDVASLVDWIEDHFDLELRSGRQALSIQVDDPSLAVAANQASLRVALGVLVESVARSAGEETVIRLAIESRGPRVRFTVHTGGPCEHPGVDQGSSAGPGRESALLALGLPTAQAAIEGMGGQLERIKHRGGGEQLAFELARAVSGNRI